MHCVDHQCSRASLAVLFSDKNRPNQLDNAQIVCQALSVVRAVCVRPSWSTALPFCAVQWDNICNWQPFTARSVPLPPPQWKDTTCCPVGSVIPSSHKGHICERCLLGFHTKEHQQASINGLQAAELCSNVPTPCPLDGWVHKEKTPVPGPPASHRSLPNILFHYTPHIFKQWR